ncbi:hypothetical protein GIB67_026128 [Kingdonia uniflora]|uniref:Protein TIC 20 n=1 Tax=Kingdonia uniflora TaxID=39325 RepID=A0A7J7M347_9MAGN|nr:hypothetical protein GIB67_026128 [Kingdonia uniflora]
MIPFFNSWLSVRNNFLVHPILRVVYDPIFPLLNFYKSIPNVGFVTFVALIVGVMRDRRFSRYVRFNSLQVLLLDFVLVIPPYFITKAMGWFQTDEGLGLKVVEICGNGNLFYWGFACKALKEDGYEVTLINLNPATIMTDPDLVNRTYITPMMPS